MSSVLETIRAIKIVISLRKHDNAHYTESNLIALRASKIPFVSRDSLIRKEVQHPSEPLGLKHHRHIFTRQRNYSCVIRIFSLSVSSSLVIILYPKFQTPVIWMNHGFAMEREFIFATNVFTYSLLRTSAQG